MKDFEQSTSTSFIELGDFGLGSIEASYEQQEKLEELTQSLATGSLHKTLEKPLNRKQNLAMCIDGRTEEIVESTLAPNSAGGSLSLYAADILCGSKFENLEEMIEYLDDAGYEIGGHTDSHAHDEYSGCGANDKMPLIMDFIAKNPKEIQSLAAKFDIEMPDEIIDRLAINAAAFDDGLSGSQRLSVLASRTDPDKIHALEGDHKEIIIAMNTKPNTTLDRNLVRAKFGSDYQVFNVDVWSFRDAAESISTPNSEQIESIFLALCAYNFATAAILTGPRMRVVTI